MTINLTRKKLVRAVESFMHEGHGLARDDCNIRVHTPEEPPEPPYGRYPNQGGFWWSCSVHFTSQTLSDEMVIRRALLLEALTGGDDVEVDLG